MVMENGRLSQNLWGHMKTMARSIEGTTGVAEEVQHRFDTDAWRLLET